MLTRQKENELIFERYLETLLTEGYSMTGTQIDDAKLQDIFLNGMDKNKMKSAMGSVCIVSYDHQARQNPVGSSDRSGSQSPFDVDRTGKKARPMIYKISRMNGVFGPDYSGYAKRLYETRMNMKNPDGTDVYPGDLWNRMIDASDYNRVGGALYTLKAGSPDLYTSVMVLTNPPPSVRVGVLKDTKQLRVLTAEEKAKFIAPREESEVVFRNLKLGSIIWLAFNNEEFVVKPRTRQWEIYDFAEASGAIV